MPSLAAALAHRVRMHVRRGTGAGAAGLLALLLSGHAAHGQMVAAVASHGAAAASPTSKERPEGQEWASVPVGGLTREVDVELYGTTRVTSPGALVVVRYAFNSYEDQENRVRLHLHLPDGWTVLDRDAEGKEMLLEAWETIEGEVRVSVPRDARPGERQVVRVVGEVVGESGGAAVFSYVQVMRRGGLQAGQVGMTGTTSLLATNVPMEGFAGARYGSVVDLSGKLSRQATLSFNYRQGLRENNLTNYRIAQEESRWSGTLRNTAWNVQVGNQINSIGNALTGPYVRGQGVSLRRTQGLLVGELTVAQPTSYTADPAGHLVRGSLSLSGSAGHAGLVFSEFGRPGGYSTAPRYPEDLHPDSLERLERERKALEKASRNRVQGVGTEVEWTHAKVHRLVARAGWMRLSSARGDSTTEPSAEAQYSFTHRRASLNARWRQMPTSLQGIYLPGDETSLDGSLKVIGDLRVSTRAYRSIIETMGNAYVSNARGASAGIGFFRQGWRADLRGNVREWSYGEHPTVARTWSLSLGGPIGPVSLNLYSDLGEQQRDTIRQPTESYNGALRWAGKSGSASWSASYYETLNSLPRLRTDLLGSLKLGEWEMAGGAWATRGWTSAGEPGFWTQLGVPVSDDLLLSVGIEHAPPAWAEPPTWMGTLGIRKRLAFAIPMLRDAGVVAPLTAGGADRK
jgi:hypothetical protein